jgi:leader peptidase (prepilin peptidase) / N-methyltransferase
MIPITAIIAALIGALLGGLVTIVTIRLPRESTFRGWPRCTRCQQPLTWWQVVPIVGWLAQGGTARCCGKRLHWIFPVAECITACSIAWLYIRYGLSPLFFYLSFVSVILIIVGAIDWLHRSIYLFIVLGSAVIVVAAASFVAPHNLLNAVLGLLAAGFIFLIFFILGRLLFPSHSVPFGLGDVYLALFLGAAFGITRLAPVLFSGMLLAGIFSVGVIVLRYLGKAVPVYISYGTFLCLGALGYVLYRGL